MKPMRGRHSGGERGFRKSQKTLRPNFSASLSLEEIRLSLVELVLRKDPPGKTLHEALGLMGSTKLPLSK